MLLDSSLKLEAVMGGAHTTSAPEVKVDYEVWNAQGLQAKPAPYRVALNGATDVTILAAPPENVVFDPTRVSIYNKDTVSQTFTVKTDASGTEFIEHKITLGTLETAKYEKGRGWYVLDTSGAVKTSVTTLEASFTPAAAFGGATTGITYGTQQGKSYKVGNVYHFRLRLTLTSNGSATGAFTITGLPYTAGSSPAGSVSVYANNLTGTSGGIVATTSGTTLLLWFLGTGTASQLDDTTVTDTADFIIGGTIGL